MSFPKPTLAQFAADPQLRGLLRAFAEKEYTSENVDFYFSTESNEAQYNKYISPGALQMVNLAHAEFTALTGMARRGQWNLMTPVLREAKASIGRLMTDNVVSRFAKSAAYSRWYVMKHKTLTEKGVKAFALLKKDLGIGKKEADLKALMLVVEGGRTPSDRKAAFEKINKLMKLNVKAATHFRTAGLAVN